MWCHGSGRPSRSALSGPHLLRRAWSTRDVTRVRGPRGWRRGRTSRVRVSGRQDRTDRVPHGAKPAAELTTNPVHRRVLGPRLPDRPQARPHRQPAPRRGHVLVLLHERADRARRLGAHPASHPPPDPHRATHRGSIHHVHLDPAVSVSDDPARPAAHQRRSRPHRRDQPATLVPLQADHVQAGQAHQ